MTKPDRQLIAQVMLYSQGFRTAEVLASKIVPFFKYVFKLLPTVAIALILSGCVMSSCPVSLTMTLVCVPSRVCWSVLAT